MDGGFADLLINGIDLDSPTLAPDYAPVAVVVLPDAGLGDAAEPFNPRALVRGALDGKTSNGGGGGGGAMA